MGIQETNRIWEANLYSFFAINFIGTSFSSGSYAINSQVQQEATMPVDNNESFHHHGEIKKE